MKLQKLSSFLKEHLEKNRGNSYDSFDPLDEGFRDEFGIYKELEELIENISDYLNPGVNKVALERRQQIIEEYFIQSAGGYAFPASLVSDYEDLCFLLVPKDFRKSGVWGSFMPAESAIQKHPELADVKKYPYSCYVNFPVLNAEIDYSYGYSKVDDVDLSEMGFRLTNLEFNSLRSTLRHEIAHYLDYKNYKSMDEFIEKNNPRLHRTMEDYFKSSTETNSFFKQILFDFIDYVREFRFMDSSKGKAKFEMIMMSPDMFYMFYEDNFLEKIKKEGLEAVVVGFLTAVPDAAKRLKECIMELYDELKADPTLVDRKSRYI